MASDVATLALFHLISRSRPLKNLNALHLSGALLAIAGILKCYALAGDWQVGSMSSGGRSPQALLALGEIGGGVWLLSGFCQCASRVAAILCFCIFTVIAAQKAIEGRPSCGCFGRLEVNPWLTVVLDVAVLSLLARHTLVRACASLPKRALPGHWLRGAAIAASFAAGVSLLLANSVKGRGLFGQGEDRGRVVVLSGEDWIGRSFPVADSTNIGDQLSHGSWDVLLYHHDCAACQDALERVKVKARDIIACAPRIAAIEVPPFEAGEPIDGFANCSAVLRGRLSGSDIWFVETPAMLHLEDGTVRAASSGADCPASLETGMATRWS